MLTIRPFDEADWNAIWQIVAPVFRAGDTYPYSPGITRDEAFDVWIATPQATYIAEDKENGAILGTYYIKANQPSQGSHVCNCGYIVADAARGRVSNVRAFTARSSAPRISRYAIQSCSGNQRRGSPPVAKDGLPNCRHAYRSIQASRTRIRRCPHHVQNLRNITKP